MVETLSLESFDGYTTPTNTTAEPAAAASYTPPNTLSSLAEDETLFRICFSRQSCDECLASTEACSWCDISQVCVANTRAPWPFQILAPIGSEEICPLRWRERWELRARPFSCRCSTMTLMSVVVTVLGSLVGVGLIVLFVRLGRRVGRRWKGRREGWWKVRLGRSGWLGWGKKLDEERPLLQQG